MNATARLTNEQVLPRSLSLAFAYQLTRTQLLVILLTLCVLFSAFSMIYVTHVDVLLNGTYQHDLTEAESLRLTQSQLLLERGTDMMPAHIEAVAEKKLGMIIPDDQSTVIVHA